MPTFLAIILIFGMGVMPVMGVSISIVMNKIKHRQRLEEMQLKAALGGPEPALVAQQNSRIELLEDRMQVLERIVTDRGLNVAEQIEALRDSNSIDQLTRDRVKDAR